MLQVCNDIIISKDAHFMSFILTGSNGMKEEKGEGERENIFI
jgi:hypothetical protein